ncbi:hypothetical protein ACFO26_00515 [Lactococcus nasutitermitis]|uniref:Exonuclease sbcC n=1 Tax=Lactococcus nasutitermitis TaxID=1652957 RepID=A0ABV9JAJ6_9LACT|nr:hypothetical protein [Lactococcus nasutitermitis]
MTKKQDNLFNFLSGLFDKNSEKESLKVSEIVGKQLEVEKKNMAEEQTVYPVDLVSHKQAIEKYRTQYQSYQEKYSTYEKIRDELLASQMQLESLSREMSEKKKLYISKMATFENTRNTYLKNVKDYQKISEEYSQVVKEMEQAQQLFNEKETILKQNQKEILQLTNKEGVQSLEYFQVKQDLEKNTELFEEAKKKFEGFNSVYQLLENSFSQKKKILEETRQKYHYANSVKNEWETLNKEFGRVKLAKASTQEKLNTINGQLSSLEGNLKVQKELIDFINPSFEMMAKKYQEHQEKYQEISEPYTKEKVIYDAEYSKYIELKRNYDEVKNSSDANEIILNFRGKALKEAEGKIEKLNEKFKPLEEKFNFRKDVFQQVSESYNIVKKLFDENQVAAKNSNQYLDNSAEGQRKLRAVLEVLNSKYNMLNQQRGQAESNYQKITVSYDRIKHMYEGADEAYGPIAEQYEEKTKQYNSVRADYEATKLNLEQVQEKEKAVKEALDDIQEWLNVAVEKQVKAEDTCRDAKTQLDTQMQKMSVSKRKITESFEKIETTFQKGQEEYHFLSGEYMVWVEDYKGYSQTYDAFGSLHDDTKEKLFSIQKFYNELVANYQTLVKSDKIIEAIYNSELTKYNVEKEYYGKIVEDYKKSLTLFEKASANQKIFEKAILTMKEFLIQNDILTFPINEATGHNFVDEYNVPEENTSKAELSVWLEKYNFLYEELEKIAKEFNQNLKDYQSQLSIFVKVGGKRIAELGNSTIAYRGSEVEEILKKVSVRVNDWKEEYLKREKVFTSVIQSYKKYLTISKTLNDDIMESSQSKDGLQMMIDLINSFGDYTDIYSSTHRNINFLANTLQMDESELTRLKTADELKILIQKKYYQPILNLINTHLEDFVEHFHNTKKNYDNSIIELNQKLLILEKETKISTRNIIFENSFLNDDDAKTYFQQALEENTKQIFSVITGNSSLINCIKKVKKFVRVANNFVVDESDNAMMFPEHPLATLTSELETNIIISPVKGIDAPVEPEKYDFVYEEPTAPESIEEKKIYIQTISEPEKIIKQHKDLQQSNLHLTTA